jgi:peptidoglycan/xylan/chitin deacetylase (PgdA/CDA1 family)
MPGQGDRGGGAGAAGSVIPALRRRLRDAAVLRRAALPVLAMMRRRETVPNWLAFPMYHHFRAGDRASFQAQLRAMRSLADFVTLDDAVDMLSRPRLSGRHVCITFDDGWRGPYEHAWPILASQDVPAAFFVVPDWIDRGGTDDNGVWREVVSWDECRQLAQAGMEVGSHSMSHARLARLDAAALQAQVTASRRRIEAELRRPCRHFACPWGQPIEDYLPERDPDAVRAAGYSSFVTTIRGRARPGTSPWTIPRIRMEPEWGLRQLHYAFAR